ncbi:DUF5592 family protein [Enterococcus termitis]|uniref:Uncharacterized protein n=1 Tax=Enterococcus termitis TaxID=332950 RepID=A0A1E5H1I0_9ENTE|nr:DUF5592 family protein [Enterococcus termitis]OEG18692.1 hypothetical protein BCR25_15955 [Enterococcus termitis]
MFTRPDKISSEIKFRGVYSLTDLAIVILIVVFGMGNLADMVYPPLRMLFRIYLGAFSLVWMLPSPVSPGMKNIQTMIELLKRDYTIYSPDSMYDMEDELDDC